MKTSIRFPKRDGSSGFEELSVENSLIIIGANGSGKSRLGISIEQQVLNSHRISAQRALAIPDFAQVMNLEQAELSLFLGASNVGIQPNTKWGYRWGNKPATHILDDYDKLLSTLFARRTKRDRDFMDNYDPNSGKIIPECEIDILLRLWNEIMPQREISFKDGKILTRKTGEAEYHGQHMSDGERVCLYLIGQSLSAPPNSIVIIDEPEIHLHKALMVRLWDAIESVCQDKVFIFITHDLDFAASRKDAKKIWVKNFNGVHWAWEEIPEVDKIPENLLIEIIGSRRNILFCEGERSSDDILLYQTIYPDYHVIPRGGSDKVIESTKALRGVESMHSYAVRGIVDRDYMQEAELVALKKAGIETIEVAEIENLYCIEPLVRIIAEHLQLNPDDKVDEVRTYIIDNLKREYDLQISNHAEREIQFRLNIFTKISDTEQGLVDGYNKVIASVDPKKIYDASKNLFDEIISENNLDKALKHYNRKSLPKQISTIFGLKGNEYALLITRLLKSSKRKEISEALQKFAPIL